MRSPRDAVRIVLGPDIFLARDGMDPADAAAFADARLGCRGTDVAVFEFREMLAQQVGKEENLFAQPAFRIGEIAVVRGIGGGAG